MSTTVVTRGKVELYDNKGKGLPLGWAVDKTGRSAENPKTILDDMFNRIGGGILPLGGEGEGFGGHKGYGLAVMVDILCAVLGGAAFGTDICDTETSSARVSHFFGAIKIDRFRDPADFRKDMDIMLERLRRSSPAEGCERVYFAGQKEFEKEAECMTEGVPLLKHTYDELCWITSEEDLEAPAASS
jgi:LDH2 family malate/lactate/ureidoglycolate dehydrogenase